MIFKFVILFSPSYGGRSLRRSSAIEVKDLPTPADGSQYNPSGSQAMFRMDSASSVDTATRNALERKDDFQSEAGDVQCAEKSERSSLQGNISAQGVDAGSFTDVFEPETMTRKRSDASRSFSEVQTSLDSGDTLKPRLSQSESLPKRKLSRQESQSQETLTKKFFPVRKTSLSESETQPAVPLTRKFSRDSSEPSPDSQPIIKEPFKPTIIRRLSRQESQGKVGRQNTLAMDCSLALSYGSKRVSSQPSLPPQKEEETTSPTENQPSSSTGDKGSRNSLMMPSETMC